MTSTINIDSFSLSSSNENDLYELRHNDIPIVQIDLKELEDGNVIYYDFNKRIPAIEKVGEDLNHIAEKSKIDFWSISGALRFYKLAEKEDGCVTAYIYEKTDRINC